jgi:TonB family protein
MTTDNYLALARNQEQQKFWKTLAGAVAGSFLLHAIAAVIFNSLPQPASDNAVEVALVDSSELPPELQSSPTPSVKISLTSTPPPSSKITPTPTPSVKVTPTPTPSVKVTPTPIPTPSVKITPVPTPTPSVKITPIPIPTPAVKVTPIPTPMPSVKITPILIPTPAVKIKPDRTPVPVKIVTQPSKSPPLQIQQTTEPVSKESDTASSSIIATNPAPAAQSNSHKIERNSPDSQTTVGNQISGATTQPTKPATEKPISPLVTAKIDPNNNKSPGNSSPINSGQQSKPELTTPNLPRSPLAAGGLGEISDSSIPVVIIPGGLDDFLASGRGTNPKLPNGMTPGQTGSGLGDKAGRVPRATLGNNPNGSNFQPLPSNGNSRNPGGSGTTIGKNPGIVSQSSPTSSSGNGSGGTNKQEIQKYFGELACLKGCKPVYSGVVTEFRQVRVNIKLNAQGRVIQTSIAESCDSPKFDNYAEARFKEMLFQLPTGSQRDFIVTMEFKPK